METTEFYLNRIQTAIDYIEDNLTRDITFQDVSRRTGYSAYHFHRIFKALVGESVTDYIRRRRLSLAAGELLASQRRILDILTDNRFNSQASFTRAFKGMYGVSPGQYRDTGKPHVLLEKKVLTSQVLDHLQRHVVLEPRITELPGFWVTGLEYRGQNKNNEIPAMWAELSSRIHEVPNRIKSALGLGVCEVKIPFTEASSFSYIAGVMTEEESLVPKGMKKLHVPAQTYAVFTHIGSPNLLELTYRYIHGVWLLKSGFQLVEANDFEWYDHRFEPESSSSEMDIYIPVRRPD